jgi:hypothetical protein
MSLFAQYTRERGGKDIIETERGFATYQFFPDSVYIEDIFVSPEYRKTNEASKMADIIAEMARSKGITKMYGTVCPSANGSTISMKVLLAYGFSLDNSSNNLIVLKKDLV